MTRLLHLDASPRPGLAGTHQHGSHTRRLTHHFVSRWRALEPKEPLINSMPSASSAQRGKFRASAVDL